MEGFNVIIQSHDDEVEFNSSAKKPVYKDEDIVTFKNRNDLGTNDSMNSNPTEEDEYADEESDKGDDGHTAVIDQDMSLDESATSGLTSDQLSRKSKIFHWQWWSLSRLQP